MIHIRLTKKSRLARLLALYERYIKAYWTHIDHWSFRDCLRLKTRIDNITVAIHYYSEEYDDLYHELLFAVGQIHPNETRHQTALRYIREAEEHKGEPVCNKE